MVEAYWDVEYDHMTFFNRHRYSGHDSIKTVLSKARRKGSVLDAANRKTTWVWRSSGIQLVI